jgi:hypothetical protein
MGDGEKFNSGIFRNWGGVSWISPPAGKSNNRFPLRFLPLPRVLLTRELKAVIVPTLSTQLFLVYFCLEDTLATLDTPDTAYTAITPDTLYDIDADTHAL